MSKKKGGGSAPKIDPAKAQAAIDAAQPQSQEAPPTAPNDIAEMYDASGEAVDIPHADVQRALASGQYGFAKDQTVHVRDSAGRVLEVPGHEAGQALQQGYGLASKDEVAAAKESAEYNTIGKGAQAFGAGAARGLTFGLSDVAASQLGGQETREHLEKLKKHHGVLSMAGEVTGAIAPVFASGGLGAAAEGAEGLGAAAHGAEALGAAGEAAQGAGLASRTIGTVGVLPRAVAGLGNMAERGAQAIVGKGATGTLGKIAQRAIPMAAQGATEGAFYGMGSEISEAALGDHELTAEKLIAGAKSGATLGGVGGAVLGAGAIVGKAAADKVLHLGGEEGLQSWLESFANQRTLKAAGAGKQDIARLGKSAEEQASRVKEIGETIRNYKFEDGEKLFKATSSTDDILHGTTRAIEEQTAKLDRTRREISKLIADKPELAPDVHGLLGRVDEEIMQPLRQSLIAEPGKLAKVDRALAPLRQRMEPVGLAEGHPLFEIWNEAQAGNPQAQRMLDVAKTKDPGLAKLIEPKPPTIDELIEARKHLDDIIYPKSVGKGVPPLPPEHQAQLVQVRRIMEDTIQNASERAAQEAGKPELFGELVDAKRTIHNLIPAKNMAEKSVSNVGNRWASPSDTGVGGAVLAGTLAGGHGGPVAALAGGMSTFAHHVVREHGSAVLAAAADKLSQLSRIRAATVAIDTKIQDGVRAALESGAVKASTERSSGTFEKHQKALDEVASSPIRHAERLAEMVGPIAAHAPQTAAMVSQRAQQTLANIQAKMPKPPTREGSLQPNLDKPRIPASDQARAERYARAAHDPLSILSDIKHNRLSYDAVDAVRDNSPKLLEQIKTTIVQHISEAKKAVPYEKRVQLGKLFGVPTDPTLEPAFVAAIRAVYADGGKGQPQGNAPNGARRPMKTTAAQALTPSQELAQGAA